MVTAILEVSRLRLQKKDFTIRNFGFYRQDTPIIVLPPLRFLSMMIMLDQYVRIMAIGNPLELMGMKLLSIIKERIL